MMRIRILSQFGDALAVKGRLAVDVDMAYNEPPEPDTVILFDKAGCGAAAEKMPNVYGAGSLQDSLELNPAFGRDIAAKNGISVKEASGPKITIDGFYDKGRRINLLVSSVLMEGNAICRIWKKPEPKLYKQTLAKMEEFLARFKYTGPLSCECAIEKQQPHFVRWIAHLQPHILWTVGPWLTVAMGTEQRNGQAINYGWVGMMTIAEYPCFLFAQDKSLPAVVSALRLMSDQIWVTGKTVNDNLTEMTTRINRLKGDKYL